MQSNIVVVVRIVLRITIPRQNQKLDCTNGNPKNSRGLPRLNGTTPLFKFLFACYQKLYLIPNCPCQRELIGSIV